MTVTGKAREEHRWLPPGTPTGRERTLSSLGYLGAAIVIPLVPLAVYLAGRASPFVRWHATQALNVALTALLYAVSGVIMGALLSLGNAATALAVMAAVAAAGWLIVVAHLVRGAAAARRGGFRQIPAWICSPLVK
ncbi:MAG TPA: DUF4870 domain-containing protein [Trebonia sp.]|jgi:uncharacterized membrane protein|nr:DUF4870 domain-containing protein [Trebonia sp.]